MGGHVVAPSIDLEGNLGGAITRSKSLLTARRRVRSSSRTRTHDDDEADRSAAYPSPPRTREPSPARDATLPPSPPRPVLNLPDEDAFWPSDDLTPPPSNPGSSRFGAIFQARVKQSGLLTPVSMDEADGESSPADLSRSPSFVVTEVPATEGLAINLDLSQASSPLPSPMLLPRQRYASEGSTSPLPSPLASTFADASPISSSSAFSSPGLFLSPNPTFPSPHLDSPASPRLSSFAEPVSKLIRRASSSSVRAELPTITTSNAYASQPSSPRLLASPTIAISKAMPRKASFATQAREKEKEKEKELRAKEGKAKKAAYHNRMFSWAVRPEDLPQDSDESRSNRLRRPMALFAVCLLLLSCAWLARPTSPAAKRPASELRVPRKTNPRSRAVGRSFIHPDVIERPHTRKSSYPQLVLKQARSMFTKASRTNLPNTPPQSHYVYGSSSKPKRKNIFVPAKPAVFNEHHALPPPPTHSDESHRDTLVLYRILGNDLPPRHSPGQTLRNLRFLLQHESDFTALPHLGPHDIHHANAYGSGSKAQFRHTEEGGLRVDKYFVLNRIADSSMKEAVLKLLDAFSVPKSRILDIPFDWEEYQRHDFRWDGNVSELSSWDVGTAQSPADDGPFSLSTRAALQHASRSSVLSEEVFKSLDSKRRRSLLVTRLRAIDYTYHDKNLYAMNNNGGRNFALEHGRSLPHARWILPLDGNSFFTPAAMSSLVQTLSIAGEGQHASRYVVIPMSRLLANQDVLKNNTMSQVPRIRQHEGKDAISEAEAVYRPAHAPDALDEPQIGFRYDSSETYQEAMRYGRRSKLELLWRLGAIPYSRGLDRRTLPWEQSDRDHVTKEAWGSIPGVEGSDTSTSPIYGPHGDYQPAIEPNPERGPLAFVKCGWVYRLFSGSKDQEAHTVDAINLRNFNRIRGIVAFLERLDEVVARGQEGCGEFGAKCGFSGSRLWNFDTDKLDQLRQDYEDSEPVARSNVETFESKANIVHEKTARVFGPDLQPEEVDAQEAATNATILAIAGHLTGNASFTTLASKVIQDRFVRLVPLFYRQNEQREMLSQSAISEDELDEYDGAGYSFPAPVRHVGQNAAWNTLLARHLAGSDLPALPFDPMAFDPSLLMDAIRVLESPDAPRSAVTISRKTLQSMFSAHLSFLLFSPEALDLSRDPPSAQVGAFYDARIAALAAFLDDARLVGRVANRARLRLPSAAREAGLFGDSDLVRSVHPMLVHGLANIQFRPYSLAAHDVAEDGFGQQVFGPDSPLSDLLEMLAA